MSVLAHQQWLLNWLLNALIWNLNSIVQPVTQYLLDEISGLPVSRYAARPVNSAWTGIVCSQGKGGIAVVAIQHLPQVPHTTVQVLDRVIGVLNP